MQEQFAHFVIFQQRSGKRRLKRIAHARALRVKDMVEGVPRDGDRTAVVHRPVHIVENPFPFAAGHAIVFDVAVIGIRPEDLGDLIVKVVLHVHAIGDIFEIVRILQAVGLAVGDQLLILLVVAVERTGAAVAVALEQVDVVDHALVGHALPLGDRPFVDALAHVVLSPILTV